MNDIFFSADDAQDSEMDFRWYEDALKRTLGSVRAELLGLKHDFQSSFPKDKLPSEAWIPEALSEIIIFHFDRQHRYSSEVVLKSRHWLELMIRYIIQRCNSDEWTMWSIHKFLHFDSKLIVLMVEDYCTAEEMEVLSHPQNELAGEFERIVWEMLDEDWHAISNASRVALECFWSE